MALRDMEKLRDATESAVPACFDDHAEELGTTRPVECTTKGPRIRDLACPVLLMNLPLSLSADVPNNAWMESMEGEEAVVDRGQALREFINLYQLLSRHAVIYLLPSRPGLQDQPFVANLAAMLHHLERETVVVSRFRSLPRVDEAAVGLEFFRMMNFDVEEPPESFRGEPLYFEGEADLKRLHGNVYVGAEGLRTSRSALEWFAETFEMEVIPFPLHVPYLYHLDCSLLPLEGGRAIVSIETAPLESLRAIEAQCEVIPMYVDEALTGITNSLVLGDTLYCDSTIETVCKDDYWYDFETFKARSAERLCRRAGLDLQFVSIPEFYKSGAGLSCMVMRLNAAR